MDHDTCPPVGTRLRDWEDAMIKALAAILVHEFGTQLNRFAHANDGVNTLTMAFEGWGEVVVTVTAQVTRNDQQKGGGD